MRLPPTQETVESVLAQATIDTWNAMGWETTWDEVPNGIGAWAKALELKPTEVKGLIEALAVRDDAAPVIYAKKGQPEPDSELRDNENVPLPLIHVQWSADVAERLATIEYRTAIDNYVTAEVHPYAPDAWVDYDKTKIGYEIPLTRHFYKYVPPRALAKIDAEIKQLETEIQELLREVAE
jgi:type I restriction enzyme M protein